MSGHSKWHNIQAKKGKADAQRGAVFTTIGRDRKNRRRNTDIDKGLEADQAPHARGE